MHPSAHRLSHATGHVLLTQLDPSSAHLSHLKAGSTCKQEAVVPASGKDMASADRHQGSSKPSVGANNLEQQDEEEEPFFELNQFICN